MTLNQAQSPSRGLEPGSVFDGRYRIVSHIGAGGMANVYKVRHLHLDQSYALKLLRRDMCSEPRQVKRFKQEAKAASNLVHPNLVNVQGFGIADDMPYLVMDYVEGDSLDMILDAVGAFPLEQALSAGKQIASALGFLHEHHIVHRDVKPGNVIRTPEGVYRVVDFGVAKLAAPDQEETVGQSLTQTGAIIGTPAYMSPEQSMSAEVDGRSDVYSLGCLLYELVTGKPPYSAETHYNMLALHLKGAVPSLADTLVDFHHQALDDVLQKCMAKDPAKRYQTMAELIADLTACESFEPRATRARERGLSNWSKRWTKQLSKHRTTAFIALALPLSVVVMVLYTMPDRQQSAPASGDEMSTEMLTILGERNLNAGNANEALGYLSRALHNIKEDQHDNKRLRGKVQRMLGVAYMRTGDSALALPHFRDSVMASEAKDAVSPDEERRSALYALGGCYAHLQRWDDSVYWLEKTVRVSPSASVRGDYGMALFHAGYLTKAEPQLRKALKDASDSDTSLQAADLLAATLVRLKRYNEAEQLIPVIRKHSQNSQAAQHRLAMIKMATGQLDEALKLEEQSRDQQHPMRRLHVANIGLIHYKQGRYFQAAIDFDEAYDNMVHQLSETSNPGSIATIWNNILWIQKARDVSRNRATTESPSPKRQD